MNKLFGVPVDRAVFIVRRDPVTGERVPEDRKRKVCRLSARARACVCFVRVSVDRIVIAVPQGPAPSSVPALLTNPLSAAAPPFLSTR